MFKIGREKANMEPKTKVCGDAPKT